MFESTERLPGAVIIHRFGNPAVAKPRFVRGPAAHFSLSFWQAADMDRAVAAARLAFDEGPWPRLTHVQRAEYLHGFVKGFADRADDLARSGRASRGCSTLSLNMRERALPPRSSTTQTSLKRSPSKSQRTPTFGGEFGLMVREPVGVVGAIVPWNAPLAPTALKIAPALLAGCAVVLKPSPEAPGEAYVIAEIAEAMGLPRGVLNVVTADREVSELTVRDARVDKITFTGSTAAGRKIASICGERIARVTLELGGKSAAVILDDFDLGVAAASIAGAECMISGQVCSSLTRVVVSRHRHDELVEALASSFADVRVGDPCDESTQMGPLAMSRQRDRVESYIAKGIADGATLAAGGGRPKDLDRGWFIEPTVFGNVDNGSTIAQEEIFGPVLSVIAADDERQAVKIANDTIYGLNASVFTNDVERGSRSRRATPLGHSRA